MGVIFDKYGPIANPPIVYSLVKLGYPTQTSLKEFIPSIQKELKAEYPIFDKRTKQGLEIIQRNDGQTLNTIYTNEFLFFDSNRERGILLTEESIIFHSATYSNFKDFIQRFNAVVDIVTNVLGISHYTSLGIRQVDAILPDYAKNEELSNYIKQNLLPFEIDGLNKISSQQVNMYQTEYGPLIFKVHWRPGNDVCIPPDLRDLSDLLSTEREVIPRPFAILDFDHIFSVPNGKVEALDTEQLIKLANKMHDISSMAFLEAINEEYAIGQWKND